MLAATSFLVLAVLVNRVLCEEQKTCKPDQFACRLPVGKCIPIMFRCDDDIDCVDGSDETDCLAAFRCNKESLDNPGLKKGTGFLANGRSFEPECLPGYQFAEYSYRRIICVQGTWKGNLQPCTPARCNKESLDYPGLDSGTGFLAYGESFEPECLPGYEATENSDRKIYCNEGEWTGNFPPCMPEPPMPPRIEVSMTTLPPGNSLRTAAGKPRRLRCICRGTHPLVKLKWLIDDTDITTMASQSNTSDVNTTKTWQAVSVLDYVFQKDDNGKLLRCVAFHATYEYFLKYAYLRLEVLSGCNKESLDYPGLDSGTGFLAYGESFEPECLPGYEATENSDRKIYCNEGEWTGNLPPCKPELPMPPRIEVSMTTLPPGNSLRTEAGKPRRLRCICRETHPLVKLKWLIDYTDITTMASQSNTSDVNTTKTWQAVSVLDYVFQKDDNGKLLRCVAFHATDESFYKDAYLRLEVLYIPEIHLEGKPVRDIEEGESVSMKCVTDANPPALVIWRKSGYYSIYSLSNNISFLEVKRSDSANYSCWATNEVGQSEAFYVNIDVKYKPSILKLFPNPGSVVSMHSNTTLTCEAEGNPPPKYSWRQKMKGDPVIWRQMGNTSSLHIPNVTHQYQGQYVCEVTNEINGYLYKAISTETSLHVIAEKQQEELPKQTSENVAAINPPCSCKYLVQDEELEAYDGNRLLKFRDEVHSGSLVMFACKEPKFYQLTGNASIRCADDCSWRSNMFPSCSNPNKNDITIRIYAGTQEDMNFNVVPDGITTAICGRSLELQCSISDDHGSTLDEKPPAHVPTCSVSSLRDVIPQGVKPYLDASITGDLPHGYLVLLGCDDVGKTGMVSKGGDSAICGTDGRWEVSVDSDCV